MHLINRLLHWTTLPAGRRLMAVLGAALVIVLACNPDLLPLLPVVDALGLDVLMLLLGAQVWRSCLGCGSGPGAESECSHAC